MTKELILFQIYLIYAERSLADFIQVVRVTVYIFTIISAADEGPDKMMCFPAGLHYLLTFLLRMSKISKKSMCFYANFFRERMSSYRHICELFQKGECLDSVDPRGNTPLQGLHQQRK